MAITNTVPWDWLEARRMTAFFVAGIVVLIDAIVHGIHAFIDVPTPPELRGALLSFAITVIALGLLGFIPGLVDRTPRLARAGGVIGAIAGIGFFVQFVWFTGALWLTAIPMPSENASPVILVYKLLIGIAILLSFLLFGVACVRSDFPSRNVGLFVLLTPFVTFIVILAVQILGSNLPRLGGGFINLGVFGGLLLATGYLLQIESENPDRADSLPGSTA